MATKKKTAKAVIKKAVKPGKPAPKKSAIKKPVAKAKPKPVSKKVVKKVKPVSKKSASAKTAKPSKKPAKLIVKSPKPQKKAAPKKQVTVKKSVIKNPMIKKTIKKEIQAKKSESKRVVAKKAAAVKGAASVKAKDIKVAPAKPVALPKITTKTSRKYQPDFTKSVLDQPTNGNKNGDSSIVRYSDTELNEFRELILRKLESAKKELTYLQGLITRKDEMGGDDTDNRYMTMEDGSMSMEREQLSQMASRQITFIDHLEKALMRIENKTYGICRVTGRLIDKARLRAVPHATLSMEAKMGAVK